jgi:hypothetical protein
MQPHEMTVGQQVNWHHRTDDGRIHIIPVTIRKIGKRIAVEARLKAGGTKLVWVEPHNLRPRKEPR